MKKIIILLLCTVPFLLTAQTTETRELSSFSKVSVSQSIKLILVKGNKNSAEITTSGNIEEVMTEVSGDKLSIHIDSKKKWTSSHKNKVEVRVTYTNSLAYLQASSSASMYVEEVIEGNELNVKATSSSSINFSAKVEELAISASSSAKVEAEAETEDLDLKVSSSAVIVIQGQSNELEASVSSSGNIKGTNLNVQNAVASASSSGKVSFSVEDKLKASASSSGRVIYTGNPRVKDVKSSSGGSVRTDSM